MFLPSEFCFGNCCISPPKPYHWWPSPVAVALSLSYGPIPPIAPQLQGQKYHPVVASPGNPGQSSNWLDNHLLNFSQLLPPAIPRLDQCAHVQISHGNRDGSYASAEYHRLSLNKADLCMLITGSQTNQYHFLGKIARYLVIH